MVVLFGRLGFFGIFFSNLANNPILIVNNNEEHKI
jgi:hypothetical protein